MMILDTTSTGVKCVSIYVYKIRRENGNMTAFRAWRTGNRKMNRSGYAEVIPAVQPVGGVYHAARGPVEVPLIIHANGGEYAVPAPAPRSQMEEV